MTSLKQAMVKVDVSVYRMSKDTGIANATLFVAAKRNSPPARSAEAFKEKVEQYMKEKGLREEIVWTEAATPVQTAPQTIINFADDIKLENEMLTQDAMKHFKLFRNPFINDIRDCRDVYLNEDSRYVLAAMKDVARNQGILAVVGDSGAGKSVLRRVLLDELYRDGDVTVIQPKIIDKTRATAAGICDAIISDISSDRPKRSMEAKARQVEQLLLNAFQGGQRHVLIIEEAHDLTIPVMKYLKRFWELEDGFSKLLGIILIGQTELNNKLDERRHYELREFIRRCMVIEVPPLDPCLEEYLSHKFERAGAQMSKIVSVEAIAALKKRLSYRKSPSASLIYPQVVNNLVTRAMNLCALLGEECVTEDVIKEL